jgi:peptide methionine sulfoxide reductase MsrA
MSLLNVYQVVVHPPVTEHTHTSWERFFLTLARFVQVCYKDTGHAEAVQLTFDPSKISFEKLLEVFFENHDPTTPNRQVRGIGPTLISKRPYFSSR